MSDWSSDVCSSDLGVARARIIKAVAPLAAQDGFERAWLIIYASMDNFTAAGTCSRSKAVSFVQNERNKSIARQFSGNGQADPPSSNYNRIGDQNLFSTSLNSHHPSAYGHPQEHTMNSTVYKMLKTITRSEEQTSELQSLMRISYAVFS